MQPSNSTLVPAIFLDNTKTSKCFNFASGHTPLHSSFFSHSPRSPGSNRCWRRALTESITNPEYTGSIFLVHLLDHLLSHVGLLKTRHRVFKICIYHQAVMFSRASYTPWECLWNDWMNDQTNDFESNVLGDYLTQFFHQDAAKSSPARSRV